MTKRTRLFVFVAAGILVAGLGTGLVASYVGQNLVTAADGPAELAYIPADAQLVGFANVREIMDSELRRKIVEFGGPDIPDRPQNFLEQEVGLNIETDIDRVVVAVSGGGPAQQPTLALVRGRFDEDLIETFVRNKGGNVQKYGEFSILSHPESNHSVAFVDDGLMAVGTDAAVRQAIQTKASGNDVRDNEELMKMLRESDDGNAWAVAKFDALTGGGRLPSELANQLPAITWFSISSYVNGGVRGTLRAQTRDEVAANDLRQVIQGFVALGRMQMRQRPEIEELLNSIVLGGDANTVSLGFAIPSELIDTIGAFHARRPAPSQAPLDPAPAAPRPAEPQSPTL